jgi:hypothetical protein
VNATLRDHPYAANQLGLYRRRRGRITGTEAALAAARLEYAARAGGNEWHAEFARRKLAELEAMSAARLTRPSGETLLLFPPSARFVGPSDTPDEMVTRTLRSGQTDR